MIEDSQQTENQTQSARRELYEVYADTGVKPRYKKKLIESLDEIYGYDLAFLVGLIMRSEFSGNLNVISQSNEISGISFSDGKITRIDLNDKDTFMGELLIKEGFLDRARLLQILQEQNKPLGELLIKNKIATKEQIILVLVKQMRLRLSKYINSTKYRVNFSESDVFDPGLSISYPEFLGLAHDWVAGRFDSEWLKLHYMELSEGAIEIPKEGGVESVKELALSKELSMILKNHSESKTFSRIFAAIKNEKDQDYFLKSFHYGIMSGQIILKNDPQAAEAQSDSILKNIYNACSKKTGAELVETLAHILKYKPTEIDAIFQAINTYVHAYTGEDDEMKNSMFRIVLEMISKKQFYYDEILKKYNTQTDPAKAAELAKKVTEVYRDLLVKNLYVAIEKLKKMNEYSSHTPKIKLYMVWAKALMIHQNNIKINISDLDRDFLQILPEDKDSAEYFYVKSILASLKKEENSAKAFYEQAMKMNPELKNYPPFKQAGSFIKNLFKMSVFLLAIWGTKTHAQNPPAPKPNLPFVYLNQYFNYQILENDTMVINDVPFNLADMTVSKTDNAGEIQVELKESLERFKNKPTFFLMLASEQKLKKVIASEEEGKFTIPKTAGAQAVCLAQRSNYTFIQICKSLVLVRQPGIKLFTVNGQEIEPQGMVILNDKNQRIKLNMVKNNNDTFNLETTLRSVLPAKIEKPENSVELDIQFVDANNARSGWDEKVNLNQNFVPIKLDNLITLKQGIYFNNDVNAETGISEVYLDRSKIQEKYFNKFIVEPIIVFNQVTGKSQTTDAVLNSDMGSGISISGDHYMDNGRNVFGGVSYYSTQMLAPNNNTRILDPKLSMISLMAGYKYNTTGKWNISGIIRLQEELFLNQATLTSIQVTKALTKMIGFVPEYTILNWSKLSMSTGFGGYLLLPNDVPNSTTTSLGFLLEADLKSSYKLGWGRAMGSISLGQRNQKNDTYTYTGNHLTYKVGFTYLF